VHIKLGFLGAAQNVTGSRYGVEVNNALQPTTDGIKTVIDVLIDTA
jgi:hypothetical protein